MLRVGLTGSIAVGKSFVREGLERLGCHTIDADQLARHVVAPGSVGLRSIVEAFGTEVLREDGTLDRTRLGRIVFADEERRKMLNAILHPLVIAEQDALLRKWEASDPHGIGVVEAALMIEAGSYKRFNTMIVVHCRTEVQLARLMMRNHLPQAEAERRVQAQMDQSEKIRFADHTVDTTNGFEQAEKQVEEVYLALRRLAAALPKTRVRNESV